MQWRDSAITLSRNISLRSSLARPDCISFYPRTSDEHCPQWSSRIVISMRLHEPIMLTRISRATMIVRSTCGEFITSSRAQTSRVTLIRSSRVPAMQRPSPTASPAPSMATSSIGGLWNDVVLLLTLMNRPKSIIFGLGYCYFTINRP